ncbi:MAG TPA: hypothetical protein VN667_17125 [Burkholderiales bacterium]|nr:hypothetical protein [Burkholderiales bacterium]
MSARLHDCDPEVQRLVKKSWVKRQIEIELARRRTWREARALAIAAYLRGHHVLQGLLAITTMLAFYLVAMDAANPLRRYGFAVGLAAQAFWLIMLARTRPFQWGTCIVAVFFLGTYAEGFHRYFL